MTLLVIVWVLSLLTLVGTGAFAFSRFDKIGAGAAGRPHDLGDFVREECASIVRYVFGLLATTKPHAERAGNALLVYGKLGHNVFSERVFGRMHFPRGNAGSFFLKHIAEHKETIRKDATERTGY